MSEWCYLCEAILFGQQRFLVDDFYNLLPVCEGCYEAALDEQDEPLPDPPTVP